jgi:hypothetical protein
VTGAEGVGGDGHEVHEANRTVAAVNTNPCVFEGSGRRKVADLALPERTELPPLVPCRTEENYRMKSIKMVENNFNYTYVSRRDHPYSPPRNICMLY